MVCITEKVFYLISFRTRHRFLISASRIRIEAKKVLFTKGILFAYQSVEKILEKKTRRKKVPREEGNRFTHNLSRNYLVLLPLWPRTGLDSVPKFSDLLETKDSDSFSSKEYVTHEKREK